MTLGERIQIILRERNVKQVEFAKQLGISANYVNLIVNDKKSTISDTLAKLIEESYGYSSHWILTGDGEPLSQDQLTADMTEVIKKIQKMSDSEVRAVLAFIETLDSINKKQNQE